MTLVTASWCARAWLLLERRALPARAAAGSRLAAAVVRLRHAASQPLTLPLRRPPHRRSVHTRQGGQLMDKRLVVAIDSWDTDSLYPCGHYVRTLGVIGDRDVETVRCVRMCLFVAVVEPLRCLHASVCALAEHHHACM